MSARAEQLHANPFQGVFYITGGGSAFLSEMLSTPGASRTVLEATVPYAFAALGELLGAAPEQACSDTTARAMAMAAFERAQQLGAAQPFGLAATASLATDRQKRGKHRAHLALQTVNETLRWHLEFSGNRAEEETLVVDALWQLVATLDGLAPPQSVEVLSAPAPWVEVLTGTSGAYGSDPAAQELILPGSFNPIHDGHRTLLKIAEQRTGKIGALELSMQNVDKPNLDYFEVARRIEGLGALPIWLTMASTFVAKAKLFPNATFAVGADTVVRIGDPRYYGDSEKQRDGALEELAQSGTQFLVFGRSRGTEFQTLEDLTLPPALRDLCSGVTEAEFRSELSSSAIRAAGRT